MFYLRGWVGWVGGEGRTLHRVKEGKYRDKGMRNEVVGERWGVAEGFGSDEKRGKG